MNTLIIVGGVEFYACRRFVGTGIARRARDNPCDLSNNNGNKKTKTSN